MRNIIRVSLFYLLVSSLSSVAIAQNQRVDVFGKIVDSATQEPLLGATLMEQGSDNGTITDFDGKFELEVTIGSNIAIKYLGYDTKIIKIEKEGNITILLQATAELMDEYTVIGYGVQRKSDITGAIASVSGDDLKQDPVANITQALQGKASGVQVVQNTGSPGSGTTVKIRGTGTINDSDPLYVVDGFIVDNIDHLNPNDIESLEVLKDAASSSIYGARAANGVVLVSTKKADGEGLKIDFNTYVGFSNPWKEIDVMNAEEFALMRDYATGDNSYSYEGKLYNGVLQDGSIGYSSEKQRQLDSLSNYSPDSWWDAVTRTGIKQQYNLSIASGNSKNSFLISSNYFDEKGIVNTSEYKRFSLRANAKNQLHKKVTLTSNMQFTTSERELVPEGQNSVLKAALYQSPLHTTYANNNYWNGNHPVAVLDRYHRNTTTYRMDINTALNIKLNDNFTYTFKVSDYVSINKLEDFNEVQKQEESFSMPGDLTNTINQHTIGNKWEVNNLMTFDWKNKIHNVGVVVGQILEGYNNENTYASRKGTASNSDQLQYLSAGYTGDYARGSIQEWSAMGFVGRLNYSLKDRYLMQTNIRADGSSKFSEDNRWGFFPSASLGWKFSSESFMTSVEWLSLGKLRLGWGQLGNSRIDYNARYSTITSNYNYTYGTSSQEYPGATATTLKNENIEWEQTESINLGLDLALFNSRITTSIEYFDKLTSNMLIRVPVVVSAGLNSNPYSNAGSVSNKGFEFNANYKSKQSNFDYEIGINLSVIRNEVVSLGINDDPVWGARLTESSIQDYVTKTIVGRPIGSFYGYVTDGIFQTQEEVDNSPQQWDNTDKKYVTPGSFRFKDLNNDGRITADDRAFIGSPHPDFYFGIPINLSYKSFTLSMFFQGQYGNDIFNVMDYYLNSAHGTGNVYADLRDKHWSGGQNTPWISRQWYRENLDATAPDLYAQDLARNFRASNFFVEDGSYIRLKNLNLNYSFSEEACKRLRVSRLSATLGAYNLLTFTRYQGLDPEIGKNTGDEGNNLYLGVDHGNYPQARTFTVGLNISL